MLCTYCHRIRTREQLIEKREYFLSLERPLIKRQKQEKKITFEDATEIRRLYNTENLNLKPIAEKYNLSETHVCDVVNNKVHIDENYVKMRIRDEKYKRRITFDVATEIRQQFNTNNVKYSVLAEKYGITEDSISAIIMNRAHHDTKYVRTNFSNKPKLDLKTAKIIREDYHNTKISYNKLAIKYGVSMSTIALVINNKIYVDSTYKKTKGR